MMGKVALEQTDKRNSQVAIGIRGAEVWVENRLFRNAHPPLHVQANRAFVRDMYRIGLADDVRTKNIWGMGRCLLTGNEEESAGRHLS